MLALVLAILVVPVLWVVQASFKPPTEVAALPPHLFVRPTLENYVELFSHTDFGRYTLNSLIVAGGSTLLGLAARRPGRLRHGLAPPELAGHRHPVRPHGARRAFPAALVPDVLRRRPHRHLLGADPDPCSHHLPVAVWVLLPYFEAMPRELVESAQVDGASSVQALVKWRCPWPCPAWWWRRSSCFVFSWNYFLFALVLSGFEHARPRSWRASTSSARASPTGVR